MTLTPIGLLVAFGAGMVSFLAPCVLPLVPGYLSYLAGTSLAVAPAAPVAQGLPAARWAVRWRVSLHALWFVVGCTLVLMLLGAAAAALGSALSTYQQLLERIGGILLILFGVALTAGVRVGAGHPAAEVGEAPSVMRLAAPGTASSDLLAIVEAVC